MPSRDWRFYAPLGIGLVVLAILYLVPTLAQHYQNTASAEYAATQEYEESKRIAPFGPSTQGPTANPQAYRDEWRAERDLHAQQDMAFWAKWLLIATVIAVLLVAATLLETRRAGQAALEMVEEAKRATKAAEDSVLETRRVGEAQVRAYLTPDNVAMGFENDCPVVTLEIENSGASPAFDTEVRVAVIYSFSTIPDAGGISGEVGSQFGTIRPRKTVRDRIHVGTTIIPEETWNRLLNDESIFFKAIIGISFKDVFKRTITEKFEFFVHARQARQGMTFPMSAIHEFRHDSVIMESQRENRSA
jgi:Sec-independent protein translocase protein TatA